MDMNAKLDTNNGPATDPMVYAGMTGGDVDGARSCFCRMAWAVSTMGDSLHALRKATMLEREAVLNIAADRINEAILAGRCEDRRMAVRTVEPFIDLIYEYAIERPHDVRGFIPVIVAAMEDDVAAAYGLKYR